MVTYSSSLAGALHGSAAYVLTGAVERVWLTERSVGTAFDCSIRVRLALQVGQKSLLKNTFTSSVSRRVVPLSSVPQEMLTEAAGELSQSAALGIRQKVLP